MPTCESSSSADAAILGSLARWLAGSLARWLAGSLARWLAGSLARWLAGSLAWSRTADAQHTAAPGVSEETSSSQSGRS